MDGSNVHTSVVIEVANQEEPDDQKMYKIDFDDVEPPKDYVIDQIFCGENITVYALFEISDVTNRSSDKKLVEVTDSAVSEDYRFYHRNSYKKAINEKAFEGCKQNLSMINFEEQKDIHGTRNIKDESFYCLQHFGRNYEISCRNDSPDLKVLYSKDIISKSQKSTKFKAVSKGVNTDIAQCPKLVEEIQKAITLNFPFAKTDNKSIEIASYKPSYEMLEMEMRQSCSSISTVIEDKKCGPKSSPNLLLVPLLMTEEGMFGCLKKAERNQKYVEEKTMIGEPFFSSKRISQGINTDFAAYEALNREIGKEIKDETNFEGVDVNNQNESKSCGCQTKSLEKIEPNSKSNKNNAKCQQKITGKEKILDEIKNLQWKLNALIKSLESDEFNFNSGDLMLEQPFSNDKIIPTATKINQEPREKEKTPDLWFKETELKRKSQKKFDDLPIFSSVNCPPIPNKGLKSRKKSDRGEKKDMSLVITKSVASINSISGSGSWTTHSFIDFEKAKNSIEVGFFDFPIHFEDSAPRKKIGLSKSESKCVFIDLKNFPKKSLSLELQEEKSEAFGLKKMKTFKIDGTLKTKTNLRTLQNGEIVLGDNLTVYKCEMGDEAAKKIKNSKSSLINQKIDENLIKVIVKSDIEIKAHEEEGDAKAQYQKHSLVVPKYIQNTEKVAVHYCSTNTTASDGLLKAEIITTPPKGKSRNIDKSSERTSKVSSDSEKPTTPNKNFKRLNGTNQNGKKETKSLNKTFSKNKDIVAVSKIERKETLNESIKRKSISCSRKSALKGTAESKLHIDKLIKKLDDPKVENFKVHLKPEEKITSKNMSSKLSRPSSQKKESREPTPAPLLPETKENINNASSKSSLVLLTTKSNDLSKNVNNNKKNFGQVLIFDKSDENCNGPLTENTRYQETPLNSSSVVVELFSKKPKTPEEFYSEAYQDYFCKGEEAVECFNNEGNSLDFDSNSESPEKPIVKSVWALTKVLLYEDGTKKFEVLEASLTPPGFSLKNEKKAGSCSQ